MAARRWRQWILSLGVAARLHPRLPLLRLRPPHRAPPGAPPRRGEADGAGLLERPRDPPGRVGDALARLPLPEPRDPAGGDRPPARRGRAPDVRGAPYDAAAPRPAARREADGPVPGGVPAGGGVPQADPPPLPRRPLPLPRDARPVRPGRARRGVRGLGARRPRGAAHRGEPAQVAPRGRRVPDPRARRLCRREPAGGRPHLVPQEVDPGPGGRAQVARSPRRASSRGRCSTASSTSPASGER